ncbi:hypothetical protein GCM10023079_00990 [Streptomyces chitinivorans]
MPWSLSPISGATAAPTALCSVPRTADPVPAARGTQPMARAVALANTRPRPRKFTVSSTSTSGVPSRPVSAAAMAAPMGTAMAASPATRSRAGRKRETSRALAALDSVAVSAPAENAMDICRMSIPSTSWNRNGDAAM